MPSRNEILKFRVTPDEKRMIEQKALSSYKYLSLYLRDCALDKEIKVVTGADNVANELRRIGNNINQLTQAVNSGSTDVIDLTEIKQALKNIWQSLNSLTRNAR